jgi:hypothetical protein
VFYTVETAEREEEAMLGVASPTDLNQAQVALSKEERLSFRDDFLVATSLGWEQVMGVLQSYVRDSETREMLEELVAA